MKRVEYDLAIIGGGSVGLIAADFARKIGARVVICERDRIGGDCTWTGCVPSKALIRVAKSAHEARTSARFGIEAHTPIVDFGAVREFVRNTIAQIDAGTQPPRLREKGIDVVLGPTSFVDAHTLAVGERRIVARNVLIATGAQPTIPSIPGLTDVPYVTYREIFENDRLPNHLIVIGAGPVGIEIAQAYARLGSRVTVFAETVLPKEEPDASEIVKRVLEREGVRFVAERPTAIERCGDAGVTVRSTNAAVDGDLLFVATGRAPTIVGLAPEKAGVAASTRGIIVNDRLQTTVPHIYAAGDVIGGEQFSHLAGWQGFTAARNALLPKSASGFTSAMPRVTFTDPEVAQVGMTEAQARSVHGRAARVTTWPITREDRAVCDDDREGIIKIIAMPKGTILGATIVGHRAGEAITELALAMDHGLSVSDVARTIHPYPTYGSGVQLLLSELAVDRLTHGLPRFFVRLATRWKRGRSDVRP